VRFTTGIEEHETLRFKGTGKSKPPNFIAQNMKSAFDLGQ
jgi:hypothetical protein